MDYILLNNGVKMPIMGFGTWNVRADTGLKAILKALSLGYRLIDTAYMYENEDIVGKALQQSFVKRDEVFITTKICTPDTSYKKAKDAIYRSLKSLKTDYIDLLLIHEPYDSSPQMYEALKEAYSEGLTRAIGISNFNAQRYTEFIEHCGIIPAINQVESHVYYPQLDLKALLERHGTAMQSWSPFTNGQRSIFDNPTLTDIGHKYGKSAAQVALCYLLEHNIAVIPKSIHETRMKENLGALDFKLDADDLKIIATLDKRCSVFNWY